MRREQRLRSKRDFDAVFRDGMRVSRGEFSAAVLDREDGAASRWGFAVSSRLGGAVVRNKIKRRLRVAASAVGGTGLDIVIVARLGSQQASVALMEQRIRELLQRAQRRMGQQQ